MFEYYLYDFMEFGVLCGKAEVICVETSTNIVHVFLYTLPYCNLLQYFGEERKSMIRVDWVRDKFFLPGVGQFLVGNEV